MSKKSRFSAKKTAFCGAMTAFALGISYVEAILPLDLGIPGAKPGLANLVSLFLLFSFGPAEAGTVLLARILLSALLFSGPIPLLYSLAGGVLSFLGMWLLRHADRFSVTAVSMAGGVLHNVGQLAVAALLLGRATLRAWLPYLLLVGALTGAIVGLLTRLLLNRQIPEKLGLTPKNA